MSIDWTTIKPVMLSLFSDMSGLQTVWGDKRRPFVDPKEQAILLLIVRDTAEIGIADRRYADLSLVKPAATLEESRAGIDRVTFDVRVESFRHDDDRFAFEMTEKVRSRLFFNANLATLRAVNVAIVRAGQAIDVPNVVQDNHITSIAVLDLVTTMSFCEANTGEANNVYNIESVDNPVDNPNTVISPFGT